MKYPFWMAKFIFFTQENHIYNPPGYHSIVGDAEREIIPVIVNSNKTWQTLKDIVE